MERVEIPSETLHGDKAQQTRKKVMDRFKSGQNKVLIATDVSARGIDIPNVDYVINYDMPEQPENYVHRVGRTGRGTQKGHALSFVSTDEESLLVAVEKYVGAEIEVLDIDASDYEDTLTFTEDTSYDWKSLMREAEAANQRPRKKKKRKKK